MGDWLSELADVRARASDLEMDPAVGRRRSAVRQAMRIRREAETFARRWPEPEPSEPQAPPICWSQLERQLADLAGCPIRAGMARDLISATPKTARFKPPEMVWREILCLAWALLDEGFPGDPPEGSAETT